MTGRRPARAFWRSLGRAGAALALAVQILLPFMALPAVAAPTPLTDAVALWGKDALCTLDPSAKQKSDHGPFAGHQCPVCWALHQGASLLPPSAIPAPALSAPISFKASVALVEAPRKPALSPPQPRGPPFA